MAALPQSLAPSSALQMSEADYFALEKNTDLRHELIDGHVYAMVGGSFNHSRITRNVARAAELHLADQVCEVFSESTKVKIPATQNGFRYVYPDVVVDCNVDQAEDHMLTTPVLIVEVLSSSTRRRDETSKRMIYSQINTLQEYVLIEQDFVKVVVMRRREHWQPEYAYLGDQITLHSIGLQLCVADIYARVQNPEMAEWLAQADATHPDEHNLSLEP